AGLDIEDAATGIVEVVSHDMADAIREITVRRGHDPRDYTLIVGGGAGGLHAARLADELGIAKVVVPRVASEFCAFGAVVADVRHDFTRSFVADTRNLDFSEVASIFDEFEAQGIRALVDEGVDEERIVFVRSVDMRYKDQVWEVTIDITDVDLRAQTAGPAVEERFHQRHEELYDFSQPGYPCELISLTVTAIGRSSDVGFRPRRTASGSDAPLPAGSRNARFERGTTPVETPVFMGHDFLPGHSVGGPAI